MSTPYAGSAAYSNSINLIGGNDPLTPASVNGPLAKLQDSQVFFGQLSDRRARIASAQGIGGIGVFASLTNTLANVTGISIATPINVQVGERMRVTCSINALATGGTNKLGQFRIQYSSLSVATTTVLSANHQQSVDATSGCESITLTGVVTATFAEIYTFRLNATYGAVAGIDISDSWIITVELLGGL
jgi:hypothetical protein